MSDIDFDELDKAVNSLMNGRGTETSAPQPQQSAPVVELANTAMPEAPLSSTPQQPVSAPEPIVPRRRGQFMDIVAPQSAKQPTTPVGRRANTVQPTTSTIVPEEPAEASPVITAFDAEPKESTGQIASEAAPELHINEPAEAATSPSSSDTQITSQDTTSATVPEDPPLTSPFLPDAKPEKRPLGSPAALSLDTLGTELEKEKTDGHAPSTPAPLATTLPEELHPELATIESEATTVSSQAPPSQEAAPVAPADSTPAESQPVLAGQPAGSVSIPQQYEEKQSSATTQQSGSIYDTNEYHQPLQHPEKKKSGVWTVVIILVCILLGAAGAALYYYLTMMR